MVWNIILSCPKIYEHKLSCCAKQPAHNKDKIWLRKEQTKTVEITAGGASTVNPVTNLHTRLRPYRPNKR